MPRRIPAIALLLLLLLVVPGRQAAGEWTADLVDAPWSPPRYVAVDKNAQTFALLRRQSPLRVTESVPCATGRELGDKFKEGDLKTPEGVYFITRRRNTGLNYELYGDLAFVLDFPNPMDVLRHKSGHGIWIHGRGHPITPYETQGCVALNMADIHRVDPELAENMPVVIADAVDVGGKDAKKIQEEGREVVAATKAWAKAWQDKSDRFFAFHDPEKFAITEGRPFSAFKNHKERLFKVLPWIKVSLFDLRAVPGPDYWVTYFIQLYRSPTLISQGLKRLYWQRGADGRFRIVGMQYDEMPVTLADKHGLTTKVATDLAEAETSTPRPDTTTSEEDLNVSQLVDAQQALVEKMAHKAFHSLPLKQQVTPEDQAILTVAMSHTPATASDAMPLIPTPPSAPLPPAKPAHAAHPTRVSTPATAPISTPAPQSPTAAKPAPSPAEIAKKFTEQWRAAWEQGNLDAYLACYAPKATQGRLHGARAIRDQKRNLWIKHPPATVALQDMTITPRGQDIVVRALQHYVSKDGIADTGYKTLLLTPAKTGFLIAEETWTEKTSTPGQTVTAEDSAPKAPAPQSEEERAAQRPTTQPTQPPAATAVAPHDETPGFDQAKALVETWRKAWENAQIDTYLDCYAPDTAQSGRHGRKAVRAQKTRLWATKPPRRVEISDLTIKPTQHGFTADFSQAYEGSDGIIRRGHKTLVLVPSDNGLVIARETWSRR